MSIGGSCLKTPEKVFFFPDGVSVSFPVLFPSSCEIAVRLEEEQPFYDLRAAHKGTQRAASTANCPGPVLSHEKNNLLSCVKHSWSWFVTHS